MTCQRACLSLVALAALALPAHAAPPVNVVTDPDGTIEQVRVQTSDLNLSNDDGARVMWARFKEAAQADCGAGENSRDLADIVAYRNCVQSVETDELNQLGNARVASIAHMGPAVHLVASR
jgi:UrcA family protein